ncbi:MAG: tripartite tricarboxylate transporter substrate binding protein [Eubacteriales bacterium]|jgi:putative tricarboxylic transport membrane protein
MKKTSVLLSAIVALSLLATACSNGADGDTSTTADGTSTGTTTSTSGESSGWTPSDNINWVVTSSPGGGSDIYTRCIADIMTRNKLVEQTILVTNKTDGAGEVGRLEVSRTDDEGHTLLTFNNGDLEPMVQNTDNRIENFRPIAIMAEDSRLLFFGKHTAYKDMAELLEAAKNGTHIVMGGSKGDDITTYETLLEVTGLTEDQMSYITYDATSDAITALLGGHVDFVTSKPAAAAQYVESGDMIPVVAVAMERYEGQFADVPTMSEIGDYEDFEVPVWRGVVGPGNMPDEAVQYWSDVLQAVSESEEWKTEYLDKYMLTNAFMPWDEATEYMQQYQEEVLANME